MKHKLQLLSIFLLTTILLQAQIYEVSVDQGTYQTLEGATSVTNNMEWDDPDYTIPIGFDFVLYGNTFDSLYSNDNDITLFDENFDVNDSLYSIIIPMFADIIDLGYESGESLSSIAYSTEGEAGNQICKIEWRNAGFYEEFDSSTENSFINVQLWLYEGTNEIEIHFGESEIADPFNIFENPGPLVGIVGRFDDGLETFDEFLALEGDPASPSAVYHDSTGYDLYYETSLDSMPSSGTIYSFNLINVSTDEIHRLSKQFSVQPNPAINSITLNSQMDKSKIRSISIYNNNGAFMKTIQADYDNINIEFLAPGMYNIQIQTDEGLATKRFVKIE